MHRILCRFGGQSSLCALVEYWIQGVLAFRVLHCPNVYSSLLESGVGPDWAQVTRPHWVDEPLGVLVLVLIIPDVLEHRTEVTFVVTHNNGTC